MKILLKQICGEFCTERKNPGLPELLRLTLEAIHLKKQIEIDRTGVLILSVSFMNELTSTIADNCNQNDFEKAVSFIPPLEELYVIQIKRQFALKRK